MDLSGRWSGTWANTTPDDSTGAFELDRKLNHGLLKGTIQIDGTPCLNGGDVTGALTFDQINFGAVSGQVEVAQTGTVDQNGKSMSGTYQNHLRRRARDLGGDEGLLGHDGERVDRDVRA